jgi:hypothetical protein
MAYRERWRSQFYVEYALVLAWSLCDHSPPGQLTESSAQLVIRPYLSEESLSETAVIRDEARREGVVNFKPAESERLRAGAISTYTTRRHA